jgi:hypothetical protein
MAWGRWGQTKAARAPGSGRMMSSNLRYQTRVKQLFSGNLLAYYPRIYDGVDESGNNQTGTPANLTAATGIGDGQQSASFNGSSSKLTLPNAITGWNQDAFTVMAWAKVSALADWSSVAYNRVWYLGNSGGHQCSAYVDGATANQISASLYTGSGTTRIASIPAFSRTDWFHIAVTVSSANDRIRTYINGTLVLNGAFAGTNPFVPDASAIGVRTNNSGWWKGSLAHALILDKEATPAEIFTAAKMNALQTVSLVGDSIIAKDFSVKVTENAWSWCWGNARPTPTRFINHAVGGHSIMVHGAADAAATAGDNADMVLMALGTNDDNATNAATLQAAVESQIQTVRTNNPSAIITYLNVPPRWTDNTGAVPVDKANIRAAIAAGCAAQGITCVDTFSTPWFAANQTLDGTHPATAGHSAYATQLAAVVP